MLNTVDDHHKYSTLFCKPTNPPRLNCHLALIVTKMISIHDPLLIQAIFISTAAYYMQSGLCNHILVRLYNALQL